MEGITLGHCTATKQAQHLRNEPAYCLLAAMPNCSYKLLWWDALGCEAHAPTAYALTFAQLLSS
jgi:hypothetical protein